MTQSLTHGSQATKQHATFEQLEKSTVSLEASMTGSLTHGLQHPNSIQTPYSTPTALKSTATCTPKHGRLTHSWLAAFKQHAPLRHLQRLSVSCKPKHEGLTHSWLAASKWLAAVVYPPAAAPSAWPHALLGALL